MRSEPDKSSIPEQAGWQLLLTLFCFVSVFYSPILFAASKTQQPVQLIAQSQVLAEIGDVDKAFNLLDKAYVLSEANGQTSLMLDIWLLRANYYQQQNQYRRAYQVLQQAWQLNSVLDKSIDQYRLYRNLGQAAMRAAHWQQARESLSIAADIVTTLKDPVREVDTFIKLAQAEIQLNDLKMAEQAINHSLKLARQHSIVSAQLQAGVVQAMVYARSGKIRALRKSLKQLSKTNAKMPATEQRFYNDIEIGRLYRMGNRQLGQKASWRKQAFKAWQRAYKTSELLKHTSLQSISLGYIGRLYADESRFNDAQKYTYQALQIAQHQNDIGMMFKWQLQQARIFRIQGLDNASLQAYRFAANNLLAIRDDLYSLDAPAFENDVVSLYVEQIDSLLFNLSEEENGDKVAQLLRVRELTETLNILQWENQQKILTSLVLPPRGNKLVPKGTAVIYPLALKDRLELLIFFNGEARQHTVNVNRNKLLSTAERFVAMNEIDEGRALGYREKLENWLVQPVMAELANYNIQKLAWVTSGVLAKMDWTAFYADKKAMYQQVSMAVMPSWFGRQDVELQSALKLYQRGNRNVHSLAARRDRQLLSKQWEIADSRVEE